MTGPKLLEPPKQTKIEMLTDEELIDALRSVGLCGEIQDRFGYKAACVMAIGHQGEHGWNNSSGVVNLFCRTEGCSEHGGHITRTIQQAAKTVFACDVCHKPMKP